MTGAHMVDAKTTELSCALSSASNTGFQKLRGKVCFLYINLTSWTEADNAMLLPSCPTPAEAPLILSHCRSQG